MTAVTCADRVLAWNIRLLECPPSRERVAGTFQPQPPHQPFLTWQLFFDDLFLCFDLDHVRAPPVGALALWFRSGNDHDNDNNATVTRPCVYFHHSSRPRHHHSDDILTTHIHVGTNEGDDDDADDEDSNTTGRDAVDQPPLDLSLVVHDREGCSVAEDHDLAIHLLRGCATPIPLIRNPNFRFLPIPGPVGSFSAVVTAAQTPTPSSSRGSPNKRQRIDPLAAPSSSSSSPTRRNPAPRWKLTVPPELELNVKKLYRGTCVITRNNTSWGGGGGTSMISGPGIEACHIVPKSMFKWYPLPDSDNATDQQLWNAVNSTGNCIVMDSIAHSVFDNRLLAIHPSSHGIRLFAPIKPILDHRYKKAYFRHNPPSTRSLEWHYKMSVVENMCALMLEKEGGAKRMPWREGPISSLHGGTLESTIEQAGDLHRGRATAEVQAAGDGRQATGDAQTNNDDIATLDENRTSAEDEICLSPCMTFGGSSRSTTLVSSAASPLSGTQAAAPYRGIKRKAGWWKSDDPDGQSDGSTGDKSTAEFTAYLHHQLSEEAARQENISDFAKWVRTRQAFKEESQGMNK